MVPFLIIEHWQPLGRTSWYATQGKELFCVIIIYLFTIYLFYFIFFGRATISLKSLRRSSIKFKVSSLRIS